MTVTRQVVSVLISQKDGSVFYALDCGHKIDSGRSQASIADHGAPLVAICTECGADIITELRHKLTTQP